MSIKSDAFGRVTLTDTDARKFVNQVRYGKPNRAAVESVKVGSRMVDEFAEKGFLVFHMKTSANAAKSGR